MLAAISLPSVVEPRRFDFRVDTDVLPVEWFSPDKLNLLFKGMNTEIGFAHRESTGIGLHVLTIFGSKPSVNFSDLISSGKVDGVKRHLYAPAAGNAAQRQSPDRDSGRVTPPAGRLWSSPGLAQGNPPLSVSHRFRRQGMFRQIPAGAAVGDDHLSAAVALKHSAELDRIIPLISAVSFIFIAAP